MNDILLNQKQSYELVRAMLDNIENARGDGFAYRFLSDRKYKNLLPVHAAMKVMMDAKEEHHYPSFESWFPSWRNLCQTKIIYDGNLTVRITMGDGWEKEVHQNVLAVLDELGIVP